MYIHSYQIHNVLNLYRKHLSQGSAARRGEPASLHRQSLIDQVSAEIVDRILGGTQERFENSISPEWRRMAGDGTDRKPRKETAFTYSMIDENNHKTTNTLPVENFSPLTVPGQNETRENTE